MKRLIPICVSLMMLSACGGVESDVKKVVQSGLKDPDSAKFGKFTQLDANYVCIAVNAKNSMGGYTGNQEALVRKVNGHWEVLTIQEPSIVSVDCSFEYEHFKKGGTKK